MKILTKYYGSMRLEVYKLGDRYKMIIRNKYDEHEPMYSHKDYELSLDVCFNIAEKWLTSNYNGTD